MPWGASGGSINVDDVTIKINANNQIYVASPPLSPPIGGVMAFLKSISGVPALPAGWVECNGQTLSDGASPINGEVIPDLNGFTGTQKFLRGGGASDGSTPTASGATGGVDSHSHSLPSGSGDNGMSSNAQTVISTNISASLRTITNSAGLPTYSEVVWIMRVK